MPLETPIKFNGLTINDQALRRWGIVDPAPNAVFAGSTLDPVSGTTSVVADGGSSVLSETQAAATNLTTIAFAPASIGLYQVRMTARITTGSTWTVELVRNETEVLATIAINSSVFSLFDLGNPVSLESSDHLELRAHGPSGAFRLLTVTLEGRAADPSVDWYVRLDRIDGLFDADVRDERFPNPGQDGEASGDLKDGGKTVTMTCRVIARNLDALRRGQVAVVRAFDDREHALFWGLWSTDEADNIRELYLRAKKNQKIDMPEQQATNNYQRGFTVQLRADDPYSYTVVEKSAQLVVGAVAGGLRTRLIQPILLDYPITGSPRTRAYSNQSVSTSLVTVENGGPRKTYPTIELYGPMQDPIITNVTSGKQLAWNGLVLADGDFIVVDTKEGLILRGGVSEDYTGFSAVDSDFFWLDSGQNQLSIVPFSSGAGARVLVRWRDAY